MLDLKHIVNGEAVKKLADSVSEVIKENPNKVITVAGVLGSFYILKDKKFKFKYKSGDTEVEFEKE